MSQRSSSDTQAFSTRAKHVSPVCGGKRASALSLLAEDKLGLALLFNKEQKSLQGV
jgi:hypothetical protein